MHHRDVAVPANRNRKDQYREFVNRYNFDVVEFPVALSDVKKFGEHNNMSINVYGVDSNNEVVYVL